MIWYDMRWSQKWDSNRLLACLLAVLIDDLSDGLEDHHYFK